MADEPHEKLIGAILLGIGVVGGLAMGAMFFGGQTIVVQQPAPTAPVQAQPPTISQPVVNGTMTEQNFLVKTGELETSVTRLIYHYKNGKNFDICYLTRSSGSNDRSLSCFRP